jgi:hypothetical protein
MTQGEMKSHGDTLRERITELAFLLANAQDENAQLKELLTDACNGVSPELLKRIRASINNEHDGIVNGTLPETTKESANDNLQK